MRYNRSDEGDHSLGGAVLSSIAEHIKRDLSSYIIDRKGRLYADLPGKGTMGDGSVPLEFLRDFPNLVEPFCQGFVSYSLQEDPPSPDRRYTVAQDLKSGFFKFLKERRSIELHEIDHALLKDFKKWLDCPEAYGRATKPMTRSAKLSAAQLILAALTTEPEWRPKLSPRLRFIDGAYKNAQKHVEHTEMLNDDVHNDVYEAAVKEIEKYILGWRRDQELIADSGGALMPMEEAGRSPHCCADHLSAIFDGPLPSLYELGRKSARYSRSINPVTFHKVEQMLYPSLRELVPFVIVLSLTFALNSNVVFQIKIGELNVDDRTLGPPRLRISPDKPRAGRRQRLSVEITKEIDNPATLFNYLKERTERIRPKTGEYADRLFLHFSPKSRVVMVLNVSDTPWTEALKDFCDTHKLPSFQLRQLRPTTLDLVHEVTGGDIVKTSAVAQHSSIAVTETFYKSNAMDRRNEEALGYAVSQFERWHRTDGKIDVRVRHRDVDVGAATPGFHCTDPYDSWIKGERPNSPCTAYGMCPLCPRAMVKKDCHVSWAYLNALRHKIDELQSRPGVSPDAWLDRWSPIQTELTSYWLLTFDPEARRRGAAVSMPDLPDLE